MGSLDKYYYYYYYYYQWGSGARSSATRSPVNVDQEFRRMKAFFAVVDLFQLEISLRLPKQRKHFSKCLQWGVTEEKDNNNDNDNDNG